ncbi:THO complex subunit 5 homolog [Notechis scutatus]|uniref:THO complex subunit 5 homolog n=1 Tax=Notechis scutatus TaxID=8663 RepID=A0A6J1W2H7_9SAUR|nr:THO complex subunit 5 homolog [Notechis scutatus]
MSSESSKKRKPKVIRMDGGPQEGKRSRSDIDQDTRYYSEEAEVELRDPNRDYELYKQTCQDLQRLMAEIQELKSKGHKDNAAEIEERRIQSCVHFMTLKKLNRLAHIRLKKGRDQTHEVRPSLKGRRCREVWNKWTTSGQCGRACNLRAAACYWGATYWPRSSSTVLTRICARTRPCSLQHHPTRSWPRPRMPLPLPQTHPISLPSLGHEPSEIGEA